MEAQMLGALRGESKSPPENPVVREITTAQVAATITEKQPSGIEDHGGLTDWGTGRQQLQTH
jgi:hypothetical protein